MKKVKYVPATSMRYFRLTVGGIYDVISLEYDTTVERYFIWLLDNSGSKDCFFINSSDGTLEFIDMTSEYRNEVIKEILE